MMEPEYYVFTGREVPDHVTHVLIAKALNFVRAHAFEEHPNIQEVICHDGVEKIEQFAFDECRSLRRVIMPGVKVLEEGAFTNCESLTYIDCGKLERIGRGVFNDCTSLSSIDLPSIKIVETGAFCGCRNLPSVKFGKTMESLGLVAFCNCPSLERIALPLKDGMIDTMNAANDIFQGCVKLNHVDLVEGKILDETVAALLLEEWKKDMNEEIDSINQILLSTHAGNTYRYGVDIVLGGKAQAIRTWIRTVLRKIIDYKAAHRRYVNEAAATLQSSLPNDIVLKNVFPFLDLPSYTFDGED